MRKTEGNVRASYDTIYVNATSTPESYKVYSDIAGEYAKFLMEKVLEGEEITLPARMGTVQIKGIKKKLSFNEDGTPNLPPNWAATKRLWDSNPSAKAERRVVYCTNEETSGIIYKFAWSKNRVAIENKSFYSFRLARANKRAISASIKSGKEYWFKEL